MKSQLKLSTNLIELNSNSMEEKCDVNGWTSYWTMFITYMVLTRKATLKKNKSKETPLNSIQSKFQIEIYFGMTKLLANLKPIYPIPTLMLPLSLELVH
jgi:hypothetical protein